jgi:rhamnosyltransferase
MSAASSARSESLSGSPKLVVVLSAYNGARYIAEQIESIQAQTLTDWSLLLRDDGSTDDTVRIVEDFALRDGRIRCCRDRRGNLGPPASFGLLLEQAFAGGASYVALSDQDDVWMADKLERQMRLLAGHEATAGPDHPILVHSDLAVVQDDLRPLHSSFLRHHRLDPTRGDLLRRLLVQNFVTGCTAVLNRPLLRAVLPIPRVVMHDWWLAQCAAALGSLVFLPETTVRYRQHGANAIGGRGATRLFLDACRHPRDWWVRGQRNLMAAGSQACELASRLETLSAGALVAQRSLDLVEGYCAALHGSIGPLRRLREIRRLGIRPQSLFSPLYYLRILTGTSQAGKPEPELWRGMRRA